MNRAQVAQKLKLGVRTIDNLVAEKAIPFVKFRRCIRFCPTQLEAWIQNLHNNKTAPELKKK